MKKTGITVLIIILLVLAGFGYWYFLLHGPSSSSGAPAPTSATNGFNPINRTVSGSGTSNVNAAPGNTVGTSSPRQTTIVPAPVLRLLSSTPVGGFGASDTASTTIVRWVDRGRGNVYQADGLSLNISTLSNTLLPRIYESSWNAAASSFIGTLLADSSSDPLYVYAALSTQSTSTVSATDTTGTLTPFTLKGKDLPQNIIAYAVSPKKDKLFMLMDEGGTAVGYVSTFDGKSTTKIFDTPLTQVSVDWPEDNTIAITTKGQSAEGGFLYFVNPRTGVWKKILGPIPGLSAKVSHDAKYVLVSVTGNSSDILTSIYDVSKVSGQDAVVRTLADKCAWGNFYKDLVYCGVPSQPAAATYPDDWYQGTVSFIDKIWQINAVTGEVHLVSSIVDQSDRVIDAFDLGLDAKDDYLFFMNKNDLSLWSLDLVASH
jgi:hypothetical protein